jgi:tetratricopeptide (TPR) repeat protein
MSNLDFYIDRPATDELLDGLKQALQAPAHSPLIFHAYGIGGIGKTALTKKIAQDLPAAVVIRIDIGVELKTETPLELMDKIYRQLPVLADGWREDFPDKYRQYQETRRTIEQDSQGRDLIKVTQSMAQAALPKAVGEFVKHVSQAIIDSPEQFEKFLASFPKTKGKSEDKEALRNLLLDPFGVLTDLLVKALWARAVRQPLILIFDTYEQVGSEVDGWLLRYFLREHNLQDQQIRLVITGRQKLSGVSDSRGGWQKLEQDRSCIFEVEIPRFTIEQTAAYLQRVGINDAAKVQQIYQTTRGWPYYLKEIVKQSASLDFSRIEQDLSAFLLRDDSPEQRELVKIAVCCRGFNAEILQELYQALEKEPISTELRDWLLGRSYVSKRSGVWRFDDVSRDVFRKTLWDENRSLFEQVNRLLADYYSKQSDSYVSTDSPITLKYRNEDWLRERSSLLYHSLFTRQPDSRQFVTHLLEAHHFRCHELTSGVVEEIEVEASLASHPHLSNSCRDFLQKIYPVAIWGQLILESPKIVTNIRDNVSLTEIWRYSDQLLGLARFVALYCQARHQKDRKAQDLLLAARQQAEMIKIDHDAEFSSGLFLWHVGSGFNEIDCYEEAIASYDRAVEIKPDLHDAWYNRGSTLGRLGHYEEAIASYDRAMEIKPDLHEAWNNRGISLHRLGRYEEAIASYDRAVEIKPDLHEAWYNQGNSLDQLGRYEEAIASYDRAVEIKPDKHEAWYNQGNSLDQLGRYEEAIASYDRAVEIKPDKHEAWNNRGISLGRLERYEEAIAAYDRAIEIKPDLHEAWYNQGNSLDELGRYEEAIAAYDRAVEIKPDKHEAWNNRGISLFNLGRYEEAIASYDRAVEINPDLHDAWNNRGISLGRLGRYPEAFDNYDQAITIKPDEPQYCPD